MLTPAQQHFNRVMAERRHASREPSQLEMTSYETMLHRLRLDKARLSRVQSQKAKADLKRELLPDYLPWIEGVLTADSGQSDDVLTTVMIWCCDCGNIAEALRIGQYVLRHKLPMPDQYRRTTATVLVEEICDPVLAAFKANPAVAPVAADLLEALRGLTLNEDMPDEVRSKLLKALGYTLRLTDNVESLTAAVEYLRQAAVLNPKKAGVTRDIELLQRALKKSGQPADGNDADGKPEANSTETQTATPPAQPKAKRETKKPAAKSKPAVKKKTTTARQKAAS
ncbi:phage terminase small subunit [Klebsiella aerogenes]|uniref:phage terminase small subunit n=1 Tax=Klebsiella aerogenes TaxID=548 RepID=UPI0028DE1122|nr:phage terminase small subunit [Klebsiella aerogenes]MDT8883189.1 phage terminase small subunit [Klebsiella aerogenes]